MRPTNHATEPGPTAGLSHLPIVFDPVERRRPSYAYRVVRADQALDEQRLNEFGADGWLLVGLTTRGAGNSPPSLEYVFVRAV